MIKQSIAILLFFMLISGVCKAQNVRVTEISFATSIQDRQPVGTDTTFSANVGTIYCFTHLEGAQDTTHITHVWYYKDQEKAHIDLNVASDDWRTWSSKSILQSWTGPWRVMVEDASGNVLASKSFVVQ
ncbi:MAG TPA: DUF2914 domain-containing protein [Balneolaceae bacterium]|nr:DUF2914 domain-containing protein [Balneolaceae bacterium]